MLSHGSRLILIILLQGLLNCESIAELSFPLTDVLCEIFGALDHVDDGSRCAADAMSYLSFSTSKEKGVRRGSFINKGTSFTPISVTTENSRCFRRYLCIK